jgi:hypothetical protein
MVRGRPIDYSIPVIDIAGGPNPTGSLIWALTGADLALIYCLPAIAALATRPGNLAAFLAAQAMLGVGCSPATCGEQDRLAIAMDW